MYLIRYRRADYRRFGDYIGIRNFYVVSRNNFATEHLKQLSIYVSAVSLISANAVAEKAINSRTVWF